MSSNRVTIISLDVLKQKVNVKEEQEVSIPLSNKTIVRKPLKIVKNTKTKIVADCGKTFTGAGANQVSHRERMEKFFKMKTSDLPKPKIAELACEKPLKTPQDTLRCPACNKLYARVNYEQHKKECKMKAEHKYGCVFCHYKHTDIHELRKHISSCHKCRMQRS